MSESLQNRLAPLEEHTGYTFVQWPIFWRELTAKDKLTHLERLTLPLNLLGNRVPPVLAAEFMIPMLSDAEAARDLHNTFTRIRDGQLHRLMYYDLDLEEYSPLAFVGSILHIKDDKHWKPALDLILAQTKTNSRPKITLKQKQRAEANRAAALQRLASPKTIAKPTPQQVQRAEANRQVARKKLAAKLAVAAQFVAADEAAKAAFA